MTDLIMQLFFVLCWAYSVCIFVGCGDAPKPFHKEAYQNTKDGCWYLNPSGKENCRIDTTQCKYILCDTLIYPEIEPSHNVCTRNPDVEGKKWYC